jgi:hypothetical protein
VKKAVIFGSHWTGSVEPVSDGLTLHLARPADCDGHHSSGSAEFFFAEFFLAGNFSLRDRLAVGAALTPGSH